MGMDVAQREMPPHVAHLAVLGEKLPDNPLGLAAVRAFEVAVLDQGDGSVPGTTDVVAARIDRSGEVRNEVRRARQCPRPKTAGKECRGAEHDAKSGTIP
jgi:hypothetical protein